MTHTVGVAPAPASTSLLLVWLLPTGCAQTIGIATLDARPAVLVVLIDAGTCPISATRQREARRLAGEETAPLHGNRFRAGLLAGLDRHRVKRLRRLEKLGRGVSAMAQEAIEHEQQSKTKQDNSEFIHGGHHAITQQGQRIRHPNRRVTMTPIPAFVSSTANGTHCIFLHRNNLEYRADQTTREDIQCRAIPRL